MGLVGWGVQTPSTSLHGAQCSTIRGTACMGCSGELLWMHYLGAADPGEVVRLSSDPSQGLSLVCLGCLCTEEIQIKKKCTLMIPSHTFPLLMRPSLLFLISFPTVSPLLAFWLSSFREHACHRVHRIMPSTSYCWRLQILHNPASATSVT